MAVIALTEASLDISKDFPDQDNATSMRASIVELLSTLLENKTSLEGLIVTSRGLPRMTTEFNRAKKRAVKAEETMLEEIERLRQTLGVSLSRFDSANDFD